MLWVFFTVLVFSIAMFLYNGIGLIRRLRVCCDVFVKCIVNALGQAMGAMSTSRTTVFHVAFISIGMLKTLACFAFPKLCYDARIPAAAIVFSFLCGRLLFSIFGNRYDTTWFPSQGLSLLMVPVESTRM